MHAVEKEIVFINRSKMISDDWKRNEIQIQILMLCVLITVSVGLVPKKKKKKMFTVHIIHSLYRTFLCI